MEPVKYERDFTGAGNAYAGALVAALVQYGLPHNLKDLQKIGAYATVASAVTIKSHGIPSINLNKIRSYNRRVNNYIHRL